MFNADEHRLILVRPERAAAHGSRTTQSVKTNNPAASTWPISPQFTQRAGQAPTQVPRLPRSGNSLVHVVDNAPSYLLVELAKLVRSGGGLFNRPRQGHFSLQLRNRLSLLLDAGAPVRQPRGSSPPCPQGCAQSSLAGRRPLCARSARPRNQGVARFEGQVESKLAYRWLSKVYEYLYSLYRVSRSKRSRPRGPHATVAGRGLSGILQCHCPFGNPRTEPYASRGSDELAGPCHRQALRSRHPESTLAGRWTHGRAKYFDAVMV